MAERLQEKTVKTMAGPASGNRIAYDDEVKGFGVRITAAGAKAFILNYRAAGRERRYTIGSYPDWTVSAARDRAKELKREIDNGGDPMGERHEQRAAPTMADLAQLYRDNHLPRKRPASRQNDELTLGKHILPRLGKMKVTDVRRTDAAALHRDMTKTAPIAANRCMALLSKMFAVAMAEEWRGDNPCKGIERNPENRRERYLSPAEIARLGDALALCAEKTSANAIRLLLLTGARKGETLSAKWSEFDLDAAVWIKPSAHTKTKKAHRVPLSAPALVLLSGMHAERDPACPFVFPGQVSAKPNANGKRELLALTTVRKAWIGVSKTAGLAVQVEKLTPAGKPVMDAKGKPVMVWEATVRVHDLRHTYASILASAGMSLPIIGALLGHTQAATTQRYAHLMDDPLRAATERVGAVVTGSGTAGADVVAMRRGA